MVKDKRFLILNSSESLITKDTIDCAWGKRRVEFQIEQKFIRYGIHCLVFCYAMQKYKNKRGYKNFLKTFLDLSIDEREQLSVYYFNLINQICSV